METENNSTKETLSLETEIDPAKGGGLVHEYGPASAHTVDHDSWKQVGLLLVTSFNCGYVLSFSNLMLVPLGWTWGVISLIVVGFFTAYANWLLTGFHFVNGQRFIRYRDLMGYLFGRQMFYLTWVFQFLTLLLANMGFLLLGGRALKEINSEFSGSPWRLQYFIAITGASYFIFSILVPTISSLRKWLVTSTVLTFSYIIILLVVVVKDGKSNKTRDYEIGGSTVSRVFNGFGAISAIIVSNTSGILLEIQSTLRKPAVVNMRKALYSQYSVGLAIYYGVSIVGYWAYGSVVSEYLPKELSGPKWVKVLINSGVFVQSIISQHCIWWGIEPLFYYQIPPAELRSSLAQMFVAPIHEALDTKFLKLDKGMHSRENIKRLICLRAFLFSGNTLVTAACPFMGDFINLLGSFTLVTLTFVFPSMIFIKVKGKAARLEKKVWHWANIIVFSLLAIATTISALRLIINNTKAYHFFADT